MKATLKYTQQILNITVEILFKGFFPPSNIWCRRMIQVSINKTENYDVMMNSKKIINFCIYINISIFVPFLGYLNDSGLIL